MSVRIGFELEFIATKPSDKKSYDFSYTASTLVKKFLEDDLDLKFGYYGKDPKNYCLDYEGLTHGSNEAGLELKSPVFPLNEGLKEIKRVFKWVEDKGYKINKSCGFHVGVSLSDLKKMKKIDLNKVVVLFDEKKILTKFGRLQNNMCEPHYRYIHEDIETVEVLLEDGTIAKAVKPRYGEFGYDNASIKHSSVIFSPDKFMSVNIGKIMEDGYNYIEFRAMGGANYHKRYKDVCDSIKHMANVVECACSPTLKKDLYQKRMKALIKGSK